MSSNGHSEAAEWEVRVLRSETTDTRWNARVVEHVKRALEAELAARPAVAEAAWTTPLCSFRATRRTSHPWRPGTPIRVAVVSDAAHGGGGPPSGGCDLPVLHLPDDSVEEQGQRLVGLAEIEASVLNSLGCRWDGELDQWAMQTGATIAPIARTQMTSAVPLVIFAGDPGVGKSVLARVIADRYCRMHQVRGHVLWLYTDVRGNGLVGDFSQRIRAAFASLMCLPTGDLRVLLVDEADAIAMRRSEAHAHQEDRAASGTLIQCLDGLIGVPRTLVVLTTNLAGTVDAAVRRRGMVVEFPRPNLDARRQLIRAWLPDIGARDLDRLARVTKGRTPADIERSLASTYMAAVAAGSPITAEHAVRFLRGSERTGSV